MSRESDTVAVEVSIVDGQVHAETARRAKASATDWLTALVATVSLLVAGASLVVACEATQVADETRQTAETALNRETRQEAYVDVMHQMYAFRDALWCDKTEQWCLDMQDLADGSGVMRTLVAVRLAGSTEVVGSVRGCMSHWIDGGTWGDASEDKPLNFDACSEKPTSVAAMTAQLDELTIQMTGDVGATRD